ncbi:hypothetical protein K0M31_020106 [Melipona bicolor]|uniref:Uncharacterized protein n=1 Tax=Melipona bicolor TaxID=60889 RepID=A0AA40G0X5_9HYME|nr:hypothetical protein K0M31_020106 [Melipona bicolor]
MGTIAIEGLKVHIECRGCDSIPTPEFTDGTGQGVEHRPACVPSRDNHNKRRLVGAKGSGRNSAAPSVTGGR